MRIVLIGKPGSGKGTQAGLLSGELSIPHISSGEVLRAEVKAGTELGKQVKSYIEKGEIGPAELIADTILSYMERKGIGDGYILDGFPRTMSQALSLDGRFPPQFVIHLRIENEDVARRLSKRLYCPSCERIYHEEADPPKTSGICDACGAELVRRNDDRVEVIEKRLEQFKADVVPIIEYYSTKGVLSEIDASGKPTEIQRKILDLLKGKHP